MPPDGDSEPEKPQLSTDEVLMEVLHLVRNLDSRLRSVELVSMPELVPTSAGSGERTNFRAYHHVRGALNSSGLTTTLSRTVGDSL